ncbi:MAG: type VI secretion system accessory protein TagJ [Bryobacteraceae bacterium]
MNVEGLIREGKIDDAVERLTAYLRDNPGDAKSRTVLFEVLCLNGEYQRAEKHLGVLSEGTKETQIGALLYYGALHAEKLRREMFEKETYPGPLAEGAAGLKGKLNGKPFSSIEDFDPRVAARLEVFAAGDYLWVPLEHVKRIEMDPPKKLRDLMWAPAKILTGPGFGDRELGEVLLPALAPLTYVHPDPAVRMGRVTEWCAGEDGSEHPYGQKMLVVDGEEVPFLEMRSLEIGE